MPWHHVTFISNEVLLNVGLVPLELLECDRVERLDFRRQVLLYLRQVYLRLIIPLLGQGSRNDYHPVTECCCISMGWRLTPDWARTYDVLDLLLFHLLADDRLVLIFHLVWETPDSVSSVVLLFLYDLRKLLLVLILLHNSISEPILLGLDLNLVLTFDEHLVLYRL